MAADALDAACSRGRLGVCGPCRTAHLKVPKIAVFCAADQRHADSLMSMPDESILRMSLF